MRRSITTAVLVAALSALTLPVTTSGVTSAESKPSPSCERRNNNTVDKLLGCVSGAGTKEHMAAFQEIADRHDGTRASGTPGYDDSVDYVVDKMEAAGYEVDVQTYPFTTYEQLTPGAFHQLAPDQVEYVENEDYAVMSYSGSGDVTGTLTPVDLDLGLGNGSTSGCEPEDFVGFPAGDIALIQRGGCSFAIKATNAVAAGAIGVVVFNQGEVDTPDKMALFGGNLGMDFTGDIPVFSAPYAFGEELADAGAEFHMAVETERIFTETHNVLAESRRGDPSNVVMAGAHLDSVSAGPGINDNGSGSGALLEIAEKMRKVKPQNKLRFAWWGGEESGLVGSNTYVGDLVENDPDALADISMYLNFDMVGSPNHAFMIYDGDGSDFGLVGPPGSDAIETLFERFYDERDIPNQATPFSGRSDYQAFILNDIPAGGLFTGAEGIKTPEEAELYGGIAGEQYDPCYHLACDTIDNHNEEALDVNTDAIAYVVLSYAQGLESIG